MKKFLLFTLFCVCLTSCSKEELEEETFVGAKATFEDCETFAGPDNSTNLTIAQIEEHYNSISRLKILFEKMRDDGVSGSGSYDPTIEELANQYINATDKAGAYSTTYTVTEDGCSDSAQFTINVTEECSIDAGADNSSVTLTISEIEAHYSSVSTLEVLFTNLIEEGATAGGTFQPTIEDLAMQYVDAQDKTGLYSTIYTVGSGDCTDSAELAVTVIEDPAQCEANAGADNTSTILTVGQVEEHYNSVSTLEVLFSNLIEEGVDTDGTFNPAIEDLAMQYVDAQDKTGIYSTTYTVGSGDCTDSAELAVTVIECEVNAGADSSSTTLTIAQVEEHYNSVSTLEVLFKNLIEEGATADGTFSPTIEELAMQYVDAPDKTGTYSTTYTVQGENCADSAEISVTVVE